MRQKLYALKLRLRHYIDQTRLLPEENRRLQLDLRSTSSVLDDYRTAVQQENVLSQSYKYNMEEWKREATSIREELARTRQDAQGAESELVKYGNNLEY